VVSIEVLLEIPEKIQISLMDGSYQRLGGIVRESNSKQIVAWLREGNALSDSSLIQSIAPVGRALTALSGTGMLLNLALTSASLVTTMKRLERLSANVSSLGKELHGEFKRDRDINFKAALQRARDALEASSAVNRTQSAHQVIQGLYEARENFYQDFHQALEQDFVLLAQHYLTRSMYATVSLTRCYLEIDEIDLARKRLIEELKLIKDSVREVIKKWLGDHPSIYFYKDIPQADAYRFVCLIEWVEERLILEIVVEELRTDFWNEDVIKDYKNRILNRFPGRNSAKVSDRFKNLTEALTYSEAMLENYERLCGFEIELRSLRLTNQSFAEWQDLYSGQEGFGVLIPDTPLELANND